MANEYRLHAAHAEVIRNAPTATARMATGYVEVIRSVAFVPTGGRRRMASFVN
jgi:hypothetical protein